MWHSQPSSRHLTPPEHQALTGLLLPWAPRPLPCLCPWPRAGPAAHTPPPRPALPLSQRGHPASRFSLHELEGHVSCVPCLAPLSYTHSTICKVLWGAAGRRPHTRPRRRGSSTGEAIFPGARGGVWGLLPPPGSAPVAAGIGSYPNPQSRERSAPVG